MESTWHDIPDAKELIETIKQLSAKEDPLGLSAMESDLFDALTAGDADSEVELIDRIGEKRGWKDKGPAYRAVHSLRTKLDDFAISSRGISEKYRLSVESARKGAWKIVVHENASAGAVAFWAGHLRNGRRTSIILGEPSRRIAHDSKNKAAGTPAIRSSGIPFRGVRLGDVSVMLEIYFHLKERYTPRLGYSEPQVRGARDLAATEDDNLVIIGTSRSMLAVSEEEWDPRLPMRLLEGDKLTLRRGSSSPFLSHNEGIGGCTVLVSRSTTGNDGRCVTLINGDHPLAVLEVAKQLTSDERVDNELLPYVKDTTGHPMRLPDEFQFYLRVMLSQGEADVQWCDVENFCTLNKWPGLPLRPPIDPSFHNPDWED